ncbi:CHAT domain-containing protein [Kibdelosporangium aridum]|uniref:CHAT domain-containing protein n=1 Tax=Kibdelosporangium aridum TaxID=2030 RepID=A0A428Z9M0_KIBAR|nr:CHAT domain-containing protein [Kibdelosporangium aridum]RSM84751.1 CHAT domain-containing protein [Kibdelosporangium aridum]
MTDVERRRQHLAENPLDPQAHVELAAALADWYQTLTDDEIAEVYTREPVDLLRTATGLADGDQRLEICAELGFLLLGIFEANPDSVQDRDEGIHFLTEAAELADPGVDLALAEVLIARENPDDIVPAIRYASRALDVVEDKADPLRQLSFAYVMRYEQGKQIDDLRRSQSYFRQLNALVDEPEFRAFAAQVDAMIVLRQVEENQPVPTLDQAIVDLAGTSHTVPFWEQRRRIKLAALRAVRFAWYGGEEDDYEAAVADLTELIENLDEAEANSYRAFLGMLAMTRDLPADMRKDPTKITVDRVRDLPAAMSPQALALAEQQLAAVDPKMLPDTEMVSTVNVMQAMLRGVSPSTPESEIDTALRQLSEAVDEDDPVHKALALVVLNARKSQLGGGPESTEAMFEQLITVVSEVEEDNPLRYPMADALAALINGWKTDIRTAAENTRTAKLLARAIAALPPDHPARVDLAAKVAMAAMVSFLGDRSGQSPEEIAAALAEAAGKSSSEAKFDAANAFGQTVVAAMRAVMNRDLELMDEAMAYLDRAQEVAPADHAIVRVLGALRAGLLLFRYQISGSLEDMDAAEHYVDINDISDMPLGAHIHEMARIARSMVAMRNDIAEDSIAQARQQVADLHSRMEPGDYLTDTMRTLTGQLDVLQQVFSVYNKGGRPSAADLAKLDQAVNSVLDLPMDTVMGVHDVIATALVASGHGMATRDVKKFDQAIALLGNVSARTDLTTDEQFTVAYTIGQTLQGRHELSRDYRDINNAIDRLEQARRLVTDSTASADYASLLYTLAASYHTRADSVRGDLIRAVHIGLDAIRERAADVLLQTNDVRALETAKAAKDEAADVARWCVAADQRDAAVQALEIGRAMVLHATTFETTLGALLREGGHPDIAAMYEQEAAAASAAPWNEGDSVAGPQLRTDVRRRVLKAVAHTDIADRLLAPPEIDEIRTALRDAKAAALVYMVPRYDLTPGFAVVVDSAEVTVLKLPRLIAGKEIERFVQAAETEWVFALNDLCEWAWTAAMEDILGQFGMRQRIVLVPVGELAHVPWHAARRDAPGQTVRYACHDAAISYASSARQFIESTRRQPRNWPDEPVLVGVPGNGLYWAQKEIIEIHRRCYPDGKLFGTSNVGRRRVTPAKVRDVLPGGQNPASLLHLGIHGRLTSVPMDSYLALSADENNMAGRLGVREMLGAARQRKSDAPGGLVVLAACTTDRTKQLPDEVLTLASTFLTAGAAGAVGARWEVDDLATMFFMIMFHHYLTAGYADPATALRAAQVWMLNPNRVLPPDVDPTLAQELSSIDPAQVENWAAFTYQGR